MSVPAPQSGRHTPLGSRGTRRARRRFRTAFVLSGGGNLGAIQVGMLKALTERKIVPDVVLGCSIGAINGAFFSMSPDAAGVGQLEQLWTSLDSAQLMPSGRLPSTVQMVRRGSSIYGNDGLREVITDTLGEVTTFEDLQVPFQCVATDVAAALDAWFTSGPLVEPILASSALPSVYPMVTIDGRDYVDGGVVDNVPISRAIELGARQVYVLQVGPHGRPDHSVRRPIDAFLLAYWISRNSRFARDLTNVPNGVNTVVFPTSRPDLRHDDFSHSTELIAQGYESASAYLARIEEEAAVESTLAKRLRSERLTEEVMDFVSRLRERRGSRDGGADERAHASAADAFETELDHAILQGLHLPADGDASTPDSEEASSTGGDAGGGDGNGSVG